MPAWIGLTWATTRRQRERHIDHAILDPDVVDEPERHDIEADFRNYHRRQCLIDELASRFILLIHMALLRLMRIIVTTSMSTPAANTNANMRAANTDPKYIANARPA